MSNGPPPITQAPDSTTPPRVVKPRKRHRQSPLLLAASGFVLGVLTWLALRQLLEVAFPALAGSYLALVAGVVGAAAQGRVLRPALWCAAAFSAIVILVLGYTPVVDGLIAGLVRSDPLRPASAVVVLASDSADGVAIDSSAQDRLLHAFALLRANWAPNLVISRGSPEYPSWIPAVEREMAELGLHYRIITPPAVENTHDEAVAIAAIARRRKWPSVILVTQPWHMPRAAATFEKAGLHVICSPAAESKFNTHHPVSFGGRLRAFSDWLHEAIGIRVYRWRGWA